MKKFVIAVVAVCMIAGATQYVQAQRMGMGMGMMGRMGMGMGMMGRMGMGMGRMGMMGMMGAPMQTPDEALKSILDAFDLNKDGKLDADEIKKAVDPATMNMAGTLSVRRGRGMGMGRMGMGMMPMM